MTTSRVLNCLLIACATYCTNGLNIGVCQSRGNQPASPSGLPIVTQFNINRMSSSIDAKGRMDSDDAGLGLVYPKGSGKLCAVTSGLAWGGKLGVGGEVRVRGSAYQSTLLPGKILASGEPDDPNLDHNRIYRVRRDIPPGARSADISAELQDGEGSQDLIFDQYHKDWLEWRWEEGAPYDDKDGDGRYDPNTDIPGVSGADQTIWFVANDSYQGEPEPGFSVLPLSTEIHVTIWGYARQDGLGYTSFRRYLLINKSGEIIDSMYVQLYADPDVGLFTNDLVGCDTTRSLGFGYNGYPDDAWYNPLLPPAVGFDFLQGPVVPAALLDSAIFRGRWIKGWRNLPMTSFSVLISLDAGGDPAYQDPETPLEVYNLMRGFTKHGYPWVNQTSGDTTFFPFPGDPESQAGWLDGEHIAPQDRRFMLNSGPFTMQPGDTQEVVVAAIVAGAEGETDYLSAVSLVKAYDDEAQEAYNEFFAMPEPPPAPHLSATALDGEIHFSWHENSEAVSATETSDHKGFTFQGYNLYQFPSGSSSLDEGTRIATFDVIDGVQMITERVRDPITGDSMSVARQFGTDSGIQRYLHVSTDRFNNNLPLVNGTRYYYAVTAYNYNPTPPTTAHTLESSPRIITVIPASPSPGERLGAASGDTLSYTHNAGLSDAILSVRVTNPTLVENHNYEIRIVVQDSVTLEFEGTPTTFPNPHWELWNISKNQLITPACTLFTASGADPIAERCIQVGLTAQRTWMQGKEISSVSYEPSEHYNWVGSNPSSFAYENAVNVAWRFPGPRGSSTLRPFEVFKHIEIRFDSANGQNAYTYHRSGLFSSYVGYFPQPFRVYDVTDPGSPRQVDFVFMEQVGSPALDETWAPTFDPSSEYFWIIDEEYTSAEKSEYQGTTHQTLLRSKPGLYGGAFVLVDTLQPAYSDGDLFRIEGNAYVTPDDRWTFTTAGMERTYSPELARDDLSQINVFPNPYYGVNPQELDRYGRFVTFSHLPERAIIRIFNLGGVMVRRIDKESSSQFERWDLKNQDGLPVGSGLYIAHIELPDLGVRKVLKLAIVQEQQILDRY